MKIKKVIDELSKIAYTHGGDLKTCITLKVGDDKIQEFEDISISAEALESGLIYCSIGIEDKN